MSECMTQEDAMRMSCEQAIECLENLRMLLARKSGKIHTDYCFALEKAIEELEQKADAVSVVRCKDCKRWDGVPADGTQDHECHLIDGNKEKIRIATPSDWFCPMGERREE